MSTNCWRIIPATLLSNRTRAISLLRSVAQSHVNDFHSELFASTIFLAYTSNSMACVALVSVRMASPAKMRRIGPDSTGQSR